MEQTNTTTESTTASGNDHRQTRYGRKGDPRMNLAVAAKLKNSNLSLLEALIAGGFEYSNGGNSKNGEETSSSSNDQVSLTQRKNQLSRRVRLLRQQQQTNNANLKNRQQNAAPATLKTKTSPTTKKRRNLITDISLQKQHHEPVVESSCKHSMDVSMQSSSTQHSAVVSLDNRNPMLSATLPVDIHEYDDSGDSKISADPTPTVSISTSSTSAEVINSLQASAMMAGMTLEQFALAISSCSSLNTVLHQLQQDKLDLAVTLYHNEAHTLQTKSMLAAGYNTYEAYNKAGESYQAVSREIASHHPFGDDNNYDESSNAAADGSIAKNALASVTSTQIQTTKEMSSLPPPGSLYPKKKRCRHHTTATQDIEEEGKTTSTAQAIGTGGLCCEDGQHIHRLEGKCGHKAILHAPGDGSAPHIDFVVGNHIECYQSVQPVHEATNVKLWPSNYKCEDLSCHENCRDEALPSLAPSKQQYPSSIHLKDADDEGIGSSRESSGNNNCCGSDIPHHHQQEDTTLSSDSVTFADAPKILDLNDIDFESSEWIPDFHNGDSVLGLFKLGNSGSG